MSRRYGTPRHTFTYLYSCCESPRTLSAIATIDADISFLFFSSAIPGVSFSTFLPTIINGMGFSSTLAQILTIPPNATASILTLCVTYLSDKRHVRGPFILIWCPVAMAGYVMLIVTKTSAYQLIGAILVMAGLVPCGALHLSWAGGNFSGELKRAVVIGMIVGFGNFGGQVSSSLALGCEFRKTDG